MLAAIHTSTYLTLARHKDWASTKIIILSCVAMLWFYPIVTTPKKLMGDSAEQPSIFLKQGITFKEEQKPYQHRLALNHSIFRWPGKFWICFLAKRTPSCKCKWHAF